MDYTPSAFEGLFQRASRMAHRFSNLQGAPETLSLFHRALLRFPEGQTPSPDDRDHFYRSWYIAMRSVLTDLYRAESHRKTQPLADLPAADDVSENAEEAERVAVLDTVLASLADEDEMAARIVHLRHFEELTWHQIADRLGCSYGAVQRKWSAARAWLRCELKENAKGIVGDGADE